MYFCLFISYLVPGYLKERFCYLRGFYLETNEHRPGKKKNPSNACHIGGRIHLRWSGSCIRSSQIERFIMKHMYLLRSFAPSTGSRLTVTSFWRKGVQCTSSPFIV